MKNRYFILVAACIVLLPLLATIPLPVSYFIPVRFADKPVHMLAYGGLAALITLGMYHSSKNYAPWKIFVIPGVIASLVGVVGETLQLFVPTRNFGYLDMAANVMGAVGMQIFICFFWLGIHRKKLKLSKQGIQRRKLREQGVRHEFVPLQEKRDGQVEVETAATKKTDIIEKPASPARQSMVKPAAASTPDRTPRSPRQAKAQANPQALRKRHKFVPRNDKSSSEPKSS